MWELEFWVIGFYNIQIVGIPLKVLGENVTHVKYCFSVEFVWCFVGRLGRV